jgi:hypothetical protein
MDYGTPTSLREALYTRNPASYAPVDGIPRHPDQFDELVGDLVINVRARKTASAIRERNALPHISGVVCLPAFSDLFCSWQRPTFGIGVEQWPMDRPRHSGRVHTVTDQSNVNESACS